MRMIIKEFWHKSPSHWAHPKKEGEPKGVTIHPTSGWVAVEEMQRELCERFPKKTVPIPGGVRHEIDQFLYQEITLTSDY